MAEFEFVNGLPKATTRPRREPDPKLIRFAEALQGNQGQWAKFPSTDEMSPATASRWSTAIRRKNVPPFDEGFDAKVRNGVLYVRALQPGEEPAPTRAGRKPKDEDTPA